jgi:hypothetical protein
MKHIYAFAIFGVLPLAAVANAQAVEPVAVPFTTPAPITPVAVPVASTEQHQALVIGGPAPTQLNQGTEFSVRLVRELTTKDKALHVGDRFDLETVEPIKLGSVTVFPSGTRAVGEITSFRNKGMWGKSGRFQARLLFLRLADRNFRITGQFDDKGKGGGWGAGLTSAFIFAPAGFFMTGTSATVPAGAIIKAYLDEDVPVVVAPSAPQPVAVTAPLPITTPAQ